MSDFIEVGKISRKTLTRKISFGCTGKIDPRKLALFQKELTALLARYGLKCVAAYGGKGGGAKRATRKAVAKRPGTGRARNMR